LLYLADQRTSLRGGYVQTCFLCRRDGMCATADDPVTDRETA
jgi:hypothetical protein